MKNISERHTGYKQPLSNIKFDVKLLKGARTEKVAFFRNRVFKVYLLYLKPLKIPVLFVFTARWLKLILLWQSFFRDYFRTWCLVRFLFGFIRMGDHVYKYLL